MTAIVFDQLRQRKIPDYRYALSRLALSAIGILLMFALWWAVGFMMQRNPRFTAFSGFTLERTLWAFVNLVVSGDAWRMAIPSLVRVAQGLGWALAIGAPAGLALGRSRLFEGLMQLPFQVLRMVSPLAWMPIAVLVFATWDSAIVFLIAAAAVWPIVFATAAGVKRIDPIWLGMARNLGAGRWGLLRSVIVPAVLQDILVGLRLALGTAWIVLVPAEFLGVTSGLGYAINDARDTLSYDRLSALVVLIGIIGYGLDMLIGVAVRKAHWIPTT